MMDSFDGAEEYELVGLYILPKTNFGLDRDDV